MKRFRRALLALSSTVLLAPLLVAGIAAPPADAAGHRVEAAEVAVAWQRIATRTVYTEAGLPIPVGSLYLAFTSLAVFDAAREGQRHGAVAATAAVATAAHNVLWKYFPGSRQALDGDLVATLARLPHESKGDVGAAIGGAAADKIIAARAGDGRNDPTVVYHKDPAPGVWQPSPGGGMLAPWLGFVRPVVDVTPVALDGPNPLTSAAYAADYEEVRTLGSSTSTVRTAEQTAVARFFTANAVFMYHDALCRYLDAEPLGLLPVTRLFARVDAAVANSFIATWRLKFDVGFWRPSQAIAGAATDGNAATNPDPTTWAPLVPNPAYSDYTSGHAAATAPFAEIVRLTLGDDTALVLRAAGLERSYGTLSALEHDALNARIWGGLHFRDSMEDSYYLGHTIADRVMRAIR